MIYLNHPDGVFLEAPVCPPVPGSLPVGHVPHTLLDIVTKMNEVIGSLLAHHDALVAVGILKEAG